MNAIVVDERPIVQAKDLTPELLRRHLAQSGCCLIRNLLRLSDVLHLRELAKNTYAEFDAGAAAAGGGAQQEILIARNSYGVDYRSIKRFRNFGSLPMSYCLPFTEAVCTALESTQIPPALSGWFGARAGLSLNASSVRYSERDSTVRRVFHQDGNFLGGIDAQTLNCWIALDPCGKDAPGLEVFPHRIDRLLPAGGPDSLVGWEIEEGLAYREMDSDRSWIPEFQPGDAFVFDHLHVHRTHVTEAMTRNRFAIECWTFPTLKPYQSQLLAWLENA